MDYEKAYKEALEKAEETIKYYKERKRNEASIEDLQGIFPELKESEDERIKKELIAYHRSMAAAMNGNRPCVHEAWIAWLEKQGEQKVSEYDVVKTIKERIIEHFDNHLIIDKCFSIGGLKDDILKIINEAKFEKQGEQKPMTEEFEHELAEICNQLLSEIDSEWMNNEILDCIGTSVWLNLCDETAKRYKDGLLKLAKQGEQKPAEWGEEDETTFKVMLEELEKKEKKNM